MHVIKSVDIEKLDFASNEAFKILRSNIQFCGNDIKVIAIMSSIPGEGKSDISFNLSKSLSEMGKKVILIDGDFRKSLLIKKYSGGKIVKGLSHYISGINKKEDVIYTATNESIDVIFSGPVPPNPAELLSNIRLKELVDELRETYDYIIIDTPPLACVIDAAVIAKLCDGIVLVIHSNKINYRLAKRVIDQIKKTNCNILGAVLNKFDQRNNSYYNKGYNHYYMSDNSQ